MSFVAAKCTECGANIQVDVSKDAGICSHCGTAFVTQKVINNHNTYVTKNVTKNIYGDERPEAEEYLERGETFLRLKDWGRAIKAFEQAADAEPDDYKGWLGLVRGETEEFTNLNDVYHVEHYRKALAVANIEDKKIIKNLCENFVNLSKKHRIEKEKTEKKRQELITEKMQEAQKLFDKSTWLQILAIICSTIAAFCLIICFIYWQLLVPLGIVFSLPSIIFIVRYVKLCRQRKKLLEEIQNLTSPL